MTPKPSSTAARVHQHAVRHAHAVTHHVARPSSADVAAGAVGSFIGFLVLAGLIVLVVLAARAGSKQRVERAAAFQERFKEITQSPLPPITVPELTLAPGEAAYFASAAGIIGAHTRTRRVGSSSGPSIRIAKGFYWHASTYASEPITQSYTAVDDTGRLIVTNQRIIFVGAKNSFSWPLSKILSIARFTDGVQINPENKRAVVFRTGSQTAAIIIDRARAGTLSKALSPAAPLRGPAAGG